jgi:hypothetical protein
LPTNKDKDAFENCKASPPTADTYPNTFAWFCLVSKFTDAVRGQWAGAQQAAPKGGKPKVEAKKTEEKKEVKKEDDDMDLFGDDEEVDEVTYLIGRTNL